MGNGVTSQLLLTWSGFYELAGGSAATLMGLLFVAISLNADLILAGDRPFTKRLAEQAFQNLTAVFVLALWIMVPNQSPVSLMVGITVNAIIMIIWIFIRLKATFKAVDPGLSQKSIWARLIPSLIAYLYILSVGGALVKVSGQDELKGIAIASIVLLISATRTSWDLLVRVAEIRHSKKAG